MQNQLAIWSAFFSILSLSLLTTLLVDFLVARYLMKGKSHTPSTTIDSKPKRENIFGCGIFPGILVFVILGLQILMDTDGGLRAIVIAAFAVLDVIASYSGGVLATVTTIQKTEVDFEFESEV